MTVDRPLPLDRTLLLPTHKRVVFSELGLNEGKLCINSDTQISSPKTHFHKLCTRTEYDCDVLTGVFV